MHAPDPALTRALASALRDVAREGTVELADHADVDLPSLMADPVWSRGAVRMLDPSARAALRLIARLPHGARADHLDAMARVVAPEGHDPARQLVSAGIAFPVRDPWSRQQAHLRLRILAPLAGRWHALAQDPDPDTVPPAPAEAAERFLADRAAFELGATLAAVHSLRPRTSRVSGVHKSDLRQLHGLVAALHPDQHALTETLRRLQNADLLVDEDGRLALDPSRLTEWSGALAALFALRAAEDRHRHGLLAALALLVRAEAWVPWMRLAEMAALANLASPHAIDSEAGLRATLDRLAALPGVLAEEAGGVRFLRLATPLRKALDGAEAPPHEEPRLLVQPNLQVVAPLGLGVETLATVARFARLVSVDRVAIFALEDEPARRAAVSGFDATRILAFLEARASHGVPANVARAVLDWARANGRVRVGHGIPIATDLTLEELRRILGSRAQLAPFAPGVHLADAATVSAFERTLRAAGVSVESPNGPDAPARAFQADPPRARLASLAEEARGAIARLERSG